MDKDSKKTNGRMSAIQRTRRMRTQQIRSMNQLEEQRLQATLRQMDLACSFSKKAVDRQTLQLQRSLESLERKHANMAKFHDLPKLTREPTEHLSQEPAYRSPTFGRSMYYGRQRRSNLTEPRRLTPLQVYSYPFANLRREPLGRWVRYPPWMDNEREVSWRKVASFVKD